MIGYIATVVALSVPVSLTCVHLAFPLLQGNRRPCGFAAEAQAAASAAALLMCVVMALWAGLGRGRGSASALERFGRRARDAWARWSGAAASFGYDVYRSWAKAGAEDEMEVWDGGEAGGGGVRGGSAPSGAALCHADGEDQRPAGAGAGGREPGAEGWELGVGTGEGIDR